MSVSKERKTNMTTNESNELVLLNIKIDKKTRREFRTECVKRDLNVSLVLRDFIHRQLEQYQSRVI